MTTVFESHGLACPNCGRDDDLRVLATSVVQPMPGGVTLQGGYAWDPVADITCDHCEHPGSVATFSGRKAHLVNELRKLRDLVERTMWDHVYNEREGIMPGPDCEYTAALTGIDALLAKPAVVDPQTCT
ncbi:hypothetical protein [Cupriavidus sp. CP313]